MTTDVDIVVVGAGLMGAATAAAAARRGLSVHLVEQFEPDHRAGSSHGSARIVRRAYGDELYTQLTGRAFELWREVEARSGHPLLRMLGGIDFGPDRNVPAVAAHLAASGVPHEVLPATEAGDRWPGMVFDGPVVYHAQAGTMDAGGSVRALVELAVGDGARVDYGAPVQAIVPGEDSAQVEFADRDPVRARCVVVAAGAWLEPLLGHHMTLPPMRITQRQIFHFPRVDESAPPWPSVIHEDGPAVYHLAGGVDGGPGDDRKIARHDGGPAITPATRDYAIDPANRAEVIDYVRRWLPGLVPEPRGEATCLYTSTPTEDFLVDRRGPIVVCSPCSGHGAKFAPLIGELTADLATGDADIPERFRLDAHAAGRTGAVSL